MCKPILFLTAIFCFIHNASAVPLAQVFDSFENIYRNELGVVDPCPSVNAHTFKVCSKALKNEGNAPYILHHEAPTDKVVVLFHGLSDSPYFLRSIAQAVYQQGANVVVALLPGHGKLDADEDMQDPKLASRWVEHVDAIMTLADGLGDNVYIGGFSTGGTLATQYVITHPQQVKGLLLYSGALALTSSVETMANIWGIKWLAKTLDGDYQTAGPNPYRYPSVARYSAFQLTDIIFALRAQLKKSQGLNLPVFAAHSKADNTTMFTGIEDLMAHNQGDNVLFAIPEALGVCHADLVVDEGQIADIHFDESQVVEVLPCSVPKANPLHGKMLAATLTFLQQH
ncbi:MAG: pimeloyl-ACP methyl ester carboxylesterase [Paraglaciecola sp.]|jgi:pimeloyl-ACP methyl ester carboxylesterase